MSSFTHLHVASAFSGHYGVTRPETMVEASAAQGVSALAITDRDGLYGAIKHIGACLQVGITPIVGVDLTVFDDDGSSLGRCVILAHGNNRGAGWSTLCKIVSTAHSKRLATRSSKKEIGIGRRMLAELLANGNCTLLLGPDSDVGHAVVAGNRDRAEELLENWQGLFAYPGTFAIEIVSHLTEPGTSFSSVQARRMVELADAHKIPAVLTNAVRYLEPDDALTADVLDAARNLEALGLFESQPNAQAWMKPEAKMLALAIEITEDRARAIELFDVTAKLAERCRLDAVNDCGWGKPKTPEQSALGIEGNPFEVLWQKAHAGIERYYPNANGKLLQQVQHRLGQELITINKLGFATYFLTVADVAQMIRDMKIRSQARGSDRKSVV